MRLSRSFLSINQFKNKLFDRSLMIASIMGLVSFLLLVFTTDRSPTDPNYYTDPISFLVLALIYGFRKKLSITIKCTAIILILLQFVLTETMIYGCYSFNTFLIIMIPLCSLLVFSYRITVMIYFATILSYLLVGYLYHDEIVTNTFQNVSRISSVYVWLENVLMISIISTVFVTVTTAYINSHTDLINDLKAKNEDLETQNKKLAEYAFINSHLLRAPLARMLSVSQLIEIEIDTKEHKNLILNLKSSALEMDKIVHKINETLEKRGDLNREEIIQSLN